MWRSFQDRLDQALRVVLVEDGEAGRMAKLARIRPQHAVRDQWKVPPRKAVKAVADGGLGALEHSRAALLVKVRRICDRSIPLLEEIRHAITVRVLPDPAPGKTKHGPSRRSRPRRAAPG